MTNEFDDYANHPMFGSGPRYTGLNPSDEPLKAFFHWHSPVGVRIPNTAVVADVSAQEMATVPVTHYFDSRRVCRTCGVKFIFFADDQKYWYETLKFRLDADCVNCWDCRKANRSETRSD